MHKIYMCLVAIYSLLEFVRNDKINQVLHTMSGIPGMLTDELPLVTATSLTILVSCRGSVQYASCSENRTDRASVLS